MLFFRPANRWSRELSTSDAESTPIHPMIIDNTLLPRPGDQQTGESWQTEYREAYEDLVRGNGASAFQRATRPSAN